MPSYLQDEGSITCHVFYSLSIEWMVEEGRVSSCRIAKEGIFMNGAAILKVSQPTKAVLCFQQNKQNKTRSIPSKTTQNKNKIIKNETR